MTCFIIVIYMVSWRLSRVHICISTIFSGKYLVLGRGGSIVCNLKMMLIEVLISFSVFGEELGIALQDYIYVLSHM